MSIMKTFLAAIAFACFAQLAQATDYIVGQCPVNPICFVGARVTTATFSDTYTFTIGDSPGEHYVGSSSVSIHGGRFCVGGRIQNCVILHIDSASIDGMSLIKPIAPGLIWTLDTSLSDGKHVFKVTGHTDEPTEILRWWGGSVNGMLYTAQ